MSESRAQPALPEFVSKQVTEARRFFLNLNPVRESPFDVVCGGVETTRPEYVVDREDFPYYAVEFVAEGEGTLHLDGNTFRLVPGVIFAYGPGTSHTIRSHSDNVMRKFYVDFVGTQALQMLEESKLRSASEHFVALTVGRVHEISEIYELLVRNGLNNGPMVTPICNSLAQLLFLKVKEVSLPRENSMPQAYFTFERVRKLIDEKFLHLDSAQDVAQECELTPVHLSRLFSRFSDCGAYQYLLRKKMNYAAGLLMNEGLLVKEVAAKLNFGDPFRFSRSFKRVYGIAPTDLLRTRR
ncbi:AraC family transcriptional regulator [Thalassoglobus sp. JC818]|uniref:AraC family transcriptional regulator n=1 Tax=Thalassoglobus sp. JC818 TaxID=3232136 RepID=UPI003459AD1B